MKIRYRNQVTGEIRDVNVGSAEETTVKTDTYTVNGESRPQWVLDSEWERTQREQAVAMSTEEHIFGAHHRRLTPGERAMGIKSYEQKMREIHGVPDDEEEEELVEPVDTDTEDDDEEEELLEPSSTATKPKPRRQARRTNRG